MKKNKKVIVITGGNSGLGQATAQILSKKNDVVILGKNKRGVMEVSKEIKCGGIVCDVADAAQVKKAFSQIIKRYKKVDCLINCAGVWITGPIEENNPKDIKNTILINAYGTFLTVNALASQLKKQKSGRIINVSSQAGLYSRSGRSVYSASKWAVTGFTKSIQLELAPFGISVAGFYPGFIHTNIFGKAEDKRTDFSTAMPVEKSAQALAYLVNIDDDLVINSFAIQSIKNIPK